MTQDNNYKETWKEYTKKVKEKMTWEHVYGEVQKQKPYGEDKVIGLCPLHKESDPSFLFDKKTLRFNCLSSCGKGDAFTFIAQSTGQDFKTALMEVGDKIGISRPVFKKSISFKPPIDEKFITQCIKSLIGKPRGHIKKIRGFSTETLDRNEIGWDAKRKRYTFPVRDEKGKLVNIRLYSDTQKAKMINYVHNKNSYGSPARLYGLNELVKSKDAQVIICEGEHDRLLLQQNGFLAVTGTHGCTAFISEWTKFFKDKCVVFIFDCDEAGKTAALRTIPAFKNSNIHSVRNVILPLKGTKDDKDITDFFHKHDFGKDELQDLINKTKIHSFAAKKEKPEEIIILNSFIDIEKDEYVDKKVQCEITISGETSEAFHGVEKFKIGFCAKHDKGECNDCKETVTVPHNSQEYIGSCMTTNVQLIHMLRELGCPYGQKPKIEILKKTAIKEFFCHQKVNRIAHETDEDGTVTQKIDGIVQELVEKRVYYLSSETVKPGDYLATGYVKTNPKTQQISFLIETLVPQESKYEAFKLEDNLKNLINFQKLSFKEILDDLSNNVTGIYERDEILITVLLTFFSPLHIRFNKRRIRGWILSSVIGDSGLGKSNTYEKISKFIDVGDIFSGVTGSRTGLVYACVEHKQKGWQIKIGRYPANTGKILCIDEGQHLDIQELRTISLGMDTGFIQIDKVQSRGYESKTRLIIICNPKKDAIMDNYSFGCETLKSIYPSPFIRRLDIAVFANKGDEINKKLINKENENDLGNGIITPEMLRAAIYWSWNLKTEQIEFEQDAKKYCLEQTEKISNIYGHAADIPMVSESDFRNTLARIATGFACINLSANKDFSKLIVTKKYVQMAVKFIHAIYSHDNCSLDTYSEIQRLSSELDDYDEIKEAFIKKKKDSEKFSANTENKDTFTRAIYIIWITSNIRKSDLADQLDCGEDAVRDTIRLLRKFNLISSSQKGYYKKPKFNKFLKKFMKEHPSYMNTKKGGEIEFLES